MEGKEIVKKYLEQQCKQDTVLKERYNPEYLDKCWEYIVNCAKAEANGKNNVCIEDNQVYQWASHYYLEGLFEKEKLKIEEARLKRILEDDAQEKARKQRLAEIRAEKIKEEGQMSLFDLGV